MPPTRWGHLIGHGSDDPLQPYAYRAACVLERFGYKAPHPFDYTEDLHGFDNYLFDAGVKHTSGHEMGTAPDKTVWLPVRDLWPRGAALAAIFDMLRSVNGHPAIIRYWYRPQELNTKVGGAGDSDHLYCLAIDIAWRDADDRRTAEKNIRDLQANEPWMRISIGRGNTLTHLGILTQRGARFWEYDSLPKEETWKPHRDIDRTHGGKDPT